MKCPHPNCARDGFSGENGVARHYGYAHDGSLALVERECRKPDCDEVYEAYRSRLKNGKDTFCSRECRDDCSAEFALSGEDHVMYDEDTHVTGTCALEGCDETVSRFDSTVKNDDGLMWCSKEHFDQYREGNPDYSGENSPRWLGGCSQSRGKNWTTQRKKALERADCTCENPDCDKGADELGRNPDVHHIVPYEIGIESGYFEDYVEANDLDNLIALCKEHHTGKNGIEPSKKMKMPL